jgi:hypothetical protein
MRLLLLPLLVSTVVHGQNLLVNPTFNADLSSWTVEALLGGSVLWTPDDATSDPG